MLISVGAELEWTDTIDAKHDLTVRTFLFSVRFTGKQESERCSTRPSDASSRGSRNPALGTRYRPIVFPEVGLDYSIDGASLVNNIISNSVISLDLRQSCVSHPTT